jgi:hypothetical protein
VIRVAVFVAIAFLLLGLLRLARPWLERWRSRPAGRSVTADLVRDPVCGTWIDRRIALPAARGGDAVPVCSEKCRRLLESASA